MTDHERTRRWRNRYNNEVKNMTLYYENLNNTTEVNTYKADDTFIAKTEAILKKQNNNYYKIGE